MHEQTAYARTELKGHRQPGQVGECHAGQEATLRRVVRKEEEKECDLGISREHHSERLSVSSTGPKGDPSPALLRALSRASQMGAIGVIQDRNATNHGFKIGLHRAHIEAGSSFFYGRFTVFTITCCYNFDVRSKTSIFTAKSMSLVADSPPTTDTSTNFNQLGNQKQHADGTSRLLTLRVHVFSNAWVGAWLEVHAEGPVGCSMVVSGSFQQRRNRTSTSTQTMIRRRRSTAMVKYADNWRSLRSTLAAPRS